MFPVCWGHSWDVLTQLMDPRVTVTPPKSLREIVDFCSKTTGFLLGVEMGMIESWVGMARWQKGNKTTKPEFPPKKNGVPV